MAENQAGPRLAGAAQKTVDAWEQRITRDVYDLMAFPGPRGRHGAGKETKDAAKAARAYAVPGKLVKTGKNMIAIRIFSGSGRGGFAEKPGLPMGPLWRSVRRPSDGPKLGLEMTLRRNPEGSQALSCYHPDYLTAFDMGDNPYRYYRW